MDQETGQSGFGAEVKFSACLPAGREVAARHQSVGGPPNIEFKKFAEVAELAYAQVSEACAERLEGSNPSFRTIFS